MAELARGSIQDRPWGRTLATMAMRGVTGQLTIEADGKRYWIAFDQGAVIGAGSPFSADSATRVGMTLGMLNSTQANEIARQLAHDAQANDIALATQLAKLSADQAARLARRTVAQKAARTFAIDAGQFFITDELLDEVLNPVAIDGRAIIFLGARTMMTETRMRHDSEAFATHMRLREDAVGQLPQYGFSETERPVLEQLLQGPQTLASLEATAPGLPPKHVHAIAYALYCGNAFEAGPRSRPATTMADIRPAQRVNVPVAAMPTAPTPAATTPMTAAEPRTISPALRGPAPDPRPAPRAHGSASTLPQDTHRPAAALGRASAPAVARSPGGANRSSGPANPGLKLTKGEVSAETTTTVQTLIAERLALVDCHASHFDVLGVTPATPAEQLRAAYFQVARQLHPDRLTALGLADQRHEIQRLFAAINTAFAVLSHPARRLAYEQELAHGGAAAIAAKEAEAEALASKIFSAEDAFKRGELALRRNQFGEAATAFDEAFRLKPDEGEFLAMKAWANFCAAADKTTAATQARKEFEQALRISPKAFGINLYFGRMERMAGREREAAKQFENVLLLKPNHAEAQAELRVLRTRRISASKPDGEAGKPGLFGKKK